MYSFEKYSSTSSSSSSSIVLLFHGFGQSNKEMRTLAKYLQKNGETVYAFDLPYHGKSKKDKKNSKTDLNNLEFIFNTFLKDEGIVNFKLVGYSMGAKFAISLAFLFPTKVIKLDLIAPFGVLKNKFYDLVVNTSFGRYLFKFLLAKYRFLYFISQCLLKVRVINPSTAKFIALRLIDDKYKQLLYDSWLGFRFLNLEFEKVILILNENVIHTSFYLGSYDKMLSIKKVEKKIATLNNKSFYVLNRGHDDLIYSKQLFQLLR